MKRFRWLALATTLATILSFCGGNSAPPPPPPVPTPVVAPTPPAPAPATAPVAQTDPACTCTPADPDSGDYRHAAKHIDLIAGPAVETTVTDILAWPHTTSPTFDSPRTGRELQLFHIAKAYLQNIWVVKDDCDLHMELSATADATAPRVIVETPIDASYCPARMSIATAMKAKGLSMTWGTVSSIPVEVTGMAFEDYDHVRGSTYVATSWELHPAIVTVLP